MTNRATTLIAGRRERLERLVERRLDTPPSGPEPLTDEKREYLRGEAVDLYWNELEWEHITDEEATEEGRITTLTFPGLLAYVRGLLLHEVMPDALAPANPQPAVVEEVLTFLAERVLQLEDELAGPDDVEADRLESERDLTSGLIDQVLYLYHGLTAGDIERAESTSGAIH